MSDNAAVPGRGLWRWIGALLGGIVLPFDPVLGLVLIIVGLWRPKQKAIPQGFQK